MLTQAPRIGFLMDLPSRSALKDGNKLRADRATQVTSCHSCRRGYLKKGYDQIGAVITDG